MTTDAGIRQGRFAEVPGVLRVDGGTGAAAVLAELSELAKLLPPLTVSDAKLDERLARLADAVEAAY